MSNIITIICNIGIRSHFCSSLAQACSFVPCRGFCHCGAVMVLLVAPPVPVVPSLWCRQCQLLVVALPPPCYRPATLDPVCKTCGGELMPCSKETGPAAAASAAATATTAAASGGGDGGGGKPRPKKMPRRAQAQAATEGQDKK